MFSLSCNAYYYRHYNVLVNSKRLKTKKNAAMFIIKMKLLKAQYCDVAMKQEKSTINNMQDPPGCHLPPENGFWNSPRSFSSPEAALLSEKIPCDIQDDSFRVRDADTWAEGLSDVWQVGGVTTFVLDSSVGGTGNNVSVNTGTGGTSFGETVVTWNLVEVLKKTLLSGGESSQTLETWNLKQIIYVNYISLEDSDQKTLFCNEFGQYTNPRVEFLSL